MSIKKPLCNYSGDVKELQSGDTIPSGSGLLIDMNNVWTVINDDVADTLIPDTAKPGSPQYTRTIVSGDFPVSSYVTDWNAVVTIGGKNTDGSNAHTINWILTVNGVEKGSSANVFLGTSQFWFQGSTYGSAALAAGDVIGVKMWADTTNVVDYRYVTIYILPRTYAIPATGYMASHLDSLATGPVGAISGVTYAVNGYAWTLQMVDTGIQAGILATAPAILSTLLSPTVFVNTAGSGNAGYTDTNANVNASSSAVASLMTLANQLPRYFRQF